MDIKKVLIVDDSESDQVLCNLVINQFNADIEILTAYDGQEALDVLNKEDVKPDIIFLDINMPGMDGHEFLEKYSHSEGQASVVVMLTSSTQEVDKQRALSYECVIRYFGKPLEIKHLEDLVQADQKFAS